MQKGESAKAKKWREKKALKPYAVRDRELFDEAKEELKFLYGCVGRFEAEQEIRVEKIGKYLARLNKMTPEGLACHHRILHGMPLLSPWMDMDLEDDPIAVEIEHVGAAEDDYGLSYLLLYVNSANHISDIKELRAEISFLEKQLTMESVLNEALMLRLKNFGSHMDLAEDQLTSWVGRTQTSIYLSKHRRYNKISTAEAATFVASILAEEVLALNILPDTAYRNLNQGHNETQKQIIRDLAIRAIPQQCDKCFRVGCRGRCHLFKTWYRPRRLCRCKTCGIVGHLDIECKRNATRAILNVVKQCSHCRTRNHIHLQCWIASHPKRPEWSHGNDHGFGLLAPGCIQVL